MRAAGGASSTEAEGQARHGPNVPEVSATMHLYAINGAAHRVASDETAFVYRNATLAPVYIAAWPDSADDVARIKWVRDYYQATAPHAEPGGFINLMQDDDQDRIEDNYFGNYGRLVDIKRKYDLFDGNQNIKPYVEGNACSKPTI
jgi:Berberine and berberine like